MGELLRSNDLRWILGSVGAVIVLAAGIPFFPMEYAAGFAVVAGLVLAVFTYRKYVRGRSVAAAEWSLALLFFPLVCSLRTYSMPLAIVGLGALLCMALIGKSAGASVISKWPVIALAVASIGVLVRPTSVWSSIFAVLAFSVLIVATKKASRHSAASSIIDGVGLYLIANVVAYYVLGLRSPGAGTRTGGFESVDGGVRIIYPLASSLNLPPMLAAAFLAAALILFERGPKKTLRLLGCAAAVVILLGAESRTSLILAVGLFALTLTASRIFRAVTLPVAAASLLFAFAFKDIIKPLIAPVIETVTSLAPWLSRNATSSADTSLNGREYIWEQSLWVLDWAPTTAERWLGYGAQGQMLSEASYAYAFVFGSALTNPFAASAHNSMLQQVFDAGIIGAVALGLTALLCIRGWQRLGKVNTPYIGASLAMAFSLVISSTTEVSLAPGVGQETFWVFVALLLIASTRPVSDGSDSEDAGVIHREPVSSSTR